MSANSYVTDLANRAMIRDEEKARIRVSVDVIGQRLESYFGEQVREHFCFGSYTRNTILPRCIDVRSDVDVMVVFQNDHSQPQTYLNQLRRFAEVRYATSEIAQSHPTIVLELDHIRFELVPAVRDYWKTLSIPAPASDFTDWTETDPNGFNSQLTHANQRHHSRITPLVRLLKFWNVCAGRPWPSYELEEYVVEWSRTCFFDYLEQEAKTPLIHYVYAAFDHMPAGYDLSASKREAIERGKKLAEQAHEQVLWHDDPAEADATAEQKLRRLFPEPAC